LGTLWYMNPLAQASLGIGLLRRTLPYLSALEYYWCTSGLPYRRADALSVLAYGLGLLGQALIHVPKVFSVLTEKVSPPIESPGWFAVAL
jgi:hypothetical protein